MISQAKVRRILPTIIPIIILVLVVSLVLLPAQAAEPPEDIEELQQWVYDQGYNYTVAENWITQLPPEEREALCGYRDLQAPEGPLPENVRFCSDVPTIESEYEGQPASYDAMALGYVTPIKNQVCGACWMFAATADFESDVAIGESNLLDFAEQELGDCNIWSSVGGHNFCNGGNSWMTTNFFTKYGSADETCHPYVATPGTCQGCPLLRNVDNWRMITGSDGETQITTIKNAILSYGPVYAAMYASDPGFDAYDSGVYEYWGPYPPERPTDHAVQIIGWDDSLPWSTGTGAWMIKNSWGTTTWGASGPYPGCAWVAYGAANLGDFTNAISGYGSPPDTVFYHDECGYMGWGFANMTTAYGAVRFTPSQDETLTAVDFWARDVNMGYEIKIFDTLNDLGGGNYSFGSQLGTTQTGTTAETGYYSIPLNTPVPLTSGDDFIVQVRLTRSAGWPIPIDYYTASSHPWLPSWSSIATFSGESYLSADGTQFYKPSPYDVGIRARAEQPLPPTVTSVSPNFGNQGQTLDVTITGTNFTGATDVSFGAGITVNLPFTVDSDTQITANISIAGGATLGTRDVSVTTPGGTGTLYDGFTVTPLQTLVSISPPNQTVPFEQPFTVNVNIVPSEPTRGAQFDMSFDQSLLTCTGVTEGDLYNMGGTQTTQFTVNNIDNGAGTITGAACAITGDAVPVSHPGTFAIISFTAKDVADTSPLLLSNVIVGDAVGDEIPEAEVTVTGGFVVIEPAEAVTEFALDIDDDDAAGGRVRITEVRDTSTGDPLPAVKIGSYTAEFSYDGTVLNVLEVRHKSPFTGSSTIDNTDGLTTFAGSVTGGVAAPVDLVFLTMRLIGSVEVECTGTLTFTSIVDDGGNPLEVSPLAGISYTFRRGDARADGVIHLTDYVIIAQYLVGLRDLGDGLDKVQAVNAASANWDNGFDKIHLTDYVIIAQYLVGLRDDDLNLIP